MTASWNESDIRSHLRTEWLGHSLDLRATTGSTNDDAHEAARTGSRHGHVVIADHQTRGRGSHGRAWSSPPGTDLYLSILLRPTAAETGALPFLTLATGLAIATGCERFVKQRAFVKWPNDVLLRSRKVAGVLTESTSQGSQVEYVVIGIGINVNRAEFPPEMVEEATSLSCTAGRALGRREVLGAVLTNVETEIHELESRGPGSLLERLSERLAWIDAAVEVDGQQGWFRGLDERGRALLEAADGHRTPICAGRMRLRPAT